MDRMEAKHVILEEGGGGSEGFSPSFARRRRPPAAALGGGVLLAAAVVALAVSVAVLVRENAALLGDVGELERRLAAALASAPGARDTSRASCSGHGMLEDGACRCDDCWTGATCALEVPDSQCVVAANSGTPFLFEDFWLARPAAEVRIKPAYHIGYGSVIGADCGFSGACEGANQLEEQIRALHAAVGNFNTSGFHLVVSVGSTELISAATWALADRSPGAQKARVWSAIPYYSGYSVVGFFNSSIFEWGPPTAAEPAAPDAPADRRVIEFVTSPNNPDGALRKPSVSGDGARHVFDLAYYWPHFTPVATDRAQELGPHDVAMFTLSKLTGHASTRIGWALTRDPEVAMRLQYYIAVSGQVPRENQLRALTVLRHAASEKYAIISWARERMRQRWAVLKEVFGSSSCYALQDLEPAQTDLWSGETASPSPAYAWVRCLRGEDCFEAMRSAGIAGRPGTAFGSSADHVRLELLMSDATFEILDRKLHAMQAACA